ncbi:hypothetical protein [Pseudomonas fluorescens]|uniref:hypothetical protein n=1 Tax=Pseudomonas fluorescens TaxID=294 RepID=UPI000732092E|nr:hypothetical protein [Pseudomonas fluorescens]
MSLLVDRPWPIEHDYKGNKLQIAFRYREGSDVPTHAVILPRDHDGDIYIYDVIEGPWDSYDHAVQISKSAAERWIDMQPS